MGDSAFGRFLRLNPRSIFYNLLRCLQLFERLAFPYLYLPGNTLEVRKFFGEELFIGRTKAVFAERAVRTDNAVPTAAAPANKAERTGAAFVFSHAGFCDKRIGAGVFNDVFKIPGSQVCEFVRAGYIKIARVYGAVGFYDILDAAEAPHGAEFGLKAQTHGDVVFKFSDGGLTAVLIVGIPEFEKPA